MPGAYSQALRHGVALLDELRSDDQPYLKAIHHRYAPQGLSFDAWIASLRQQPVSNASLEAFACRISRTLAAP